MHWPSIPLDSVLAVALDACGLEDYARGRDDESASMATLPKASGRDDEPEARGAELTGADSRRKELEDSDGKTTRNHGNRHRLFCRVRTTCGYTIMPKYILIPIYKLILKSIPKYPYKLTHKFIPI